MMILDDEDILVYAPRGGAGGQTVQAMAAAEGVSVLSQSLGIGVIVKNERSQHKNKAEALRLLRMLVEHGGAQVSPTPAEMNADVPAMLEQIATLRSEVAEANKMLDEAMVFAACLQTCGEFDDSEDRKRLRELVKAYNALVRVQP